MPDASPYINGTPIKNPGLDRITVWLAKRAMRQPRVRKKTLLERRYAHGEKPDAKAYAHAPEKMPAMIP